MSDPRPRLPHGTLPDIILVAISEGANNGAALQRWVEEKTGGVYRPGAGTLYPRIYTLERRGLIRRITTDNIRPVIYELSPVAHQEAKVRRSDVFKKLTKIAHDT